jgi:hypothetical protein
MISVYNNIKDLNQHLIQHLVGQSATCELVRCTGVHLWTLHGRHDCSIGSAQADYCHNKSTLSLLNINLCTVCENLILFLFVNSVKITDKVGLKPVLSAL